MAQKVTLLHRRRGSRIYRGRKWVEVLKWKPLQGERNEDRSISAVDHRARMDYRSLHPTLGIDMDHKEGVVLRSITLRCKDCVYGAVPGVCNRFPPVGKLWGQVGTMDWCGEFIAVNAPKAK